MPAGKAEMFEKEEEFINRILEKKLVSEKDMERVLEERDRPDEHLAHILIETGLAREEDILPILAEEMGVSYINLKDQPISSTALEKVPAKLAYHYKIMPVHMKNGRLTVALADPLNIQVLDDIKLMIGCDIKPALSSHQGVLEGLKKYYGIGAETVEKMIDEREPAQKTVVTKPAQDIGEMAQDASVIKFVNQILVEAVKERATDIHFEPFEDQLKIRYRIDGILYSAKIPPNIQQFLSAIVSRIKIMSNLNIAERRLPQDGRTQVRVGGEDLDLRISILPTPYGESVNIRLLSRSSTLIELEQLGFGSDALTVLEQVILKPHGVVLVTGPTGSGKSTTLYACLKILNSEEKKIITIEDPIEYHMSGVSQIQVHPKINLTFATGLRSMLRHDPDVMMVGEIRDFETAEITIRSALTGHLVFSTLHTNDAPGAITRLIDMGIEPYLISSSVECIMAQRLVRVICHDCKEKVTIRPDILQEFNTAYLEMSADTPIYQGAGCKQCKNTGYRGRTAISEILSMDNSIRELVMNRSPANKIKDRAITQGIKTLRRSGLEKVLKGITTVEEVLRVTHGEVD